jgi:DNA repair protein RadA/Sms
MSKIKTAFFCNNCGYESAKWIGKCPACNEWNTFTEEILDKGNKNADSWKENSGEKRIHKSISLHEVVTSQDKRILTSDS